MAQDTAFEILGIEPTTDGRTIRAAFLRLARIYHPDRFVGMPDDVRSEAERRMKDATLAYESLRETRRSERVPSIDDRELEERTAKYRVAMEARRAEEDRDRARWRQWERIEAEARAKAEIDAEIAARVMREAGVPLSRTEAPAEPVRQTAPASLLSQRLDAAERGESSPLARRVPAKS